MKSTSALALSLGLALMLSACAPSAPKGTTVVPPNPSGSAQPTVPAEAPPTTTTSYKSEEFIDRNRNFKFMLPQWDMDDYIDISYYCERRDRDADMAAIVGVSKYMEEVDAERYDLSGATTPKEVLDILNPKVGAVLDGKWGIEMTGCDYTTEDKKIGDLDAVKFEGEFYFGEEGDERTYYTVGYCILGANRPVLCFVVDRSKAQNQSEEFSQLIDEVAQTYVDGE